MAQPTEVVRLALEQLARRHLLDEAPPPLSPSERISRRRVCEQLARAAATLPIMLTVATPAAAQSVSVSTPIDSSTNSLTPLPGPGQREHFGSSFGGRNAEVRAARPQPALSDAGTELRGRWLGAARNLLWGLDVRRRLPRGLVFVG